VCRQEAAETPEVELEALALTIEWFDQREALAWTIRWSGQTESAREAAATLEVFLPAARKRRKNWLRWKGVHRNTHKKYFDPSWFFAS